MIIKKQTFAFLNKQLKSFSTLSAFSNPTRGLFHHKSMQLNKIFPNHFSTYGYKKPTPEEEIFNLTWEKMNEAEKMEFSIKEKVPEKYTTKKDEIYFYQGLSNDKNLKIGDALISFLKAIQSSSNQKLKLDAYEKIARLYEIIDWPDKADEVLKTREKLITQNENQNFYSNESAGFPIVMDKNMNLFLPSKYASLELVLDHGGIATAFSSGSMNLKELEELKNALNFALEQPVHCHIKRTGVAEAKLFNGITAQIQDGGIEKPTSLRVFRNNLRLIL